MKNFEELNDKQECKRNKYIKVIDDMFTYLLKGLSVIVGFTIVKGLSVIVGFTIAVSSFAIVTSVSIMVATVCGLGYAVYELGCKLKDLGDKVFGRRDDILDYYYEMEKIKDLKAAMDFSKDVQNYLSLSNSIVIIEKDARAQEKRDNRPNMIELPHNLDTMDISK